MIFKVRPLITEIVKLGDTFFGVPVIDNENGRLYKVTWWNDGHVERESLGKPVGTSANAINHRIPFDPNYPRYINGEEVEADNR